MGAPAGLFAVMQWGHPAAMERGVAPAGPPKKAKLPSLPPEAAAVSEVFAPVISFSLS